jgi:hypothetical protein
MAPRDRGERHGVVDGDTISTLSASDSGGGIVKQLVDSQFPAQETEEQERTRKTKRKPHEVKRASRQLSVTFPMPDWKDAVLYQADRWGVRTSDFLTFCVAFTMQAIDSGELRRPPVRGPIRYHHRTGEALDLPWSPEEPKRDTWR